MAVNTMLSRQITRPSAIVPNPGTSGARDGRVGHTMPSLFAGMPSVKMEKRNSLRPSSTPEEGPLSRSMSRFGIVHQKLWCCSTEITRLSFVWAVRHVASGMPSLSRVVAYGRDFPIHRVLSPQSLSGILTSLRICADSLLVLQNMLEQRVATLLRHRTCLLSARMTNISAQTHR